MYFLLGLITGSLIIYLFLRPKVREYAQINASVNENNKELEKLNKELIAEQSELKNTLMLLESEKKVLINQKDSLNKEILSYSDLLIKEKEKLKEYKGINIKTILTGCIAQVEKEKFLYLHNFNIKLFPNLKFSLTEGGLRHGPIELKFLNPAMILHSFYCSFQDFPEDAITKYNLSSNYSSYLGVTLDYYPIKNLRLYALWANTELQTSSELVSNYGKLFPDGYALQGGFNLSFPTKNSSYYAINSEILYACPFLYIKQSPDWSMVKIREDFKREKDVITWIGTPLGPDTFAFDINFEYKEPRHWSVNLGYLLTLKGEVNTDTILKTALSKSDPTDTTEYPAYYPSVSYYLGLLSEEEAIAIARKKWLSGVIEYRNDISVSSEYYFGDKFIVSAQGTYTFVKNNNHM